MHNATSSEACTECGHEDVDQVPDCTCPGCDTITAAKIGQQIAQILGMTANWSGETTINDMRACVDQATDWLEQHGIRVVTTWSDTRRVMAELQFAIVLDWFDASRHQAQLDHLRTRRIF